jgi:NAD(P)-dependent dehydrogenase (short-subunit alcohol dehydrogenase family)
VSLLVIVGYGPGISHATAERFGREGYSVALVARNNDRLVAGIERLAASGVDAKAYQADASEPASLRRAIADIRRDSGTISALLWTAFRSGEVRNVLETPPEKIEAVFDVGIAGLLACVQDVVADLKTSNGALLVANGALGEASSEADVFAKYLNNDGVALENAAKTKLVGILAERLREFGIYVGEITIVGSVAGTATAGPTAIAPSTIAQTFWSMAELRSSTRVRMTE